MKKKAFCAALPYSLPICIGFLFIAMSYGFLMRSRGFSVFYPMAMSAFIFAGSMEFVAVELLLSAYAPLHAFLLTLMVNARHLFYGISMLEKYKGMGWKKPYLIFGMCDETFSINCSAEIPPEIYFGDSKNAPYGTKEKEKVRELTIGCARKLFDQGAKGLVVACNTATSAAVRKLREMYPYIPIVGIEPALKPAALCMEHPKVLVMATPMTIHEEKFHVLMERYKEKAQILPLPCPGLMDFIERGDLDGEDLYKYLEDLLYSYRENQVDAAVLGCTHYPFARKQIQQVLGENVKIFDGGEGTAREMKRRLQEKDLLCGRQKRGQVVFENSLTDDSKIELCKKLLNI